MAEPLREYFLEDLNGDDHRDESMLYLALTESPIGKSTFRSALACEENEHYDLVSRGLFGLIALDATHAMAAALSNGDDQCGNLPSAFAYALASSANSDGKRRLIDLCEHSNSKVVNAVAKALEKLSSWEREDADQSLST